MNETSMVEPPSWTVMDVNKLKSNFADITVSYKCVEACKSLQEGNVYQTTVTIFTLNYTQY